MNELNPLTPEQVEALPAEAKTHREGALNILPSCIRMLNNFDFDANKDKVQHITGWNMNKPGNVNS